MKKDTNIGKIFGCYKILEVSESSILPSGQKRKTIYVNVLIAIKTKL